MLVRQEGVEAALPSNRSIGMMEEENQLDGVERALGLEGEGATNPRHCPNLAVILAMSQLQRASGLGILRVESELPKQRQLLCQQHPIFPELVEPTGWLRTIPALPLASRNTELVSHEEWRAEVASECACSSPEDAPFERFWPKER